jgi:hypothetical protein
MRDGVDPTFMQPGPDSPARPTSRTPQRLRRLDFACPTRQRCCRLCEKKVPWSWRTSRVSSPSVTYWCTRTRTGVCPSPSNAIQDPANEDGPKRLDSLRILQVAVPSKSRGVHPPCGFNSLLRHHSTRLLRSLRVAAGSLMVGRQASRMVSPERSGVRRQVEGHPRSFTASQYTPGEGGPSTRSSRGESASPPSPGTAAGSWRSQRPQTTGT